MQIYFQKQTQLNQTINEIQLINQYEKQTQELMRVQILARIKRILLKIPNEFQTNINYLRQCNQRYFMFINNQINQTANQSPKTKPSKFKYLYHIVSLRIKLWFNKEQFDKFFGSFILNCHRNKKITHFFSQFLIELIDTFQNQHNCQNQQDQQTIYQRRQTQKCSTRLSLTRKTNSHFFSDRIPKKKQWKITNSINSGLKKKKKFTKQNRFQRQFLDFQLNKILQFGNQIFNMSVTQNDAYNYQQQSQEGHQKLFLINESNQNVSRVLQLIHRVISYDFFHDRNHNSVDDYFNQKSPLIIPTKYSKYCQYHQFQNWIKNKNDIVKYHYLYFCGDKQIKIQIIKIFGDMLRIHQKYFRKDPIYKSHIENVVSPLKCILESLQIEQDNDLQIATILGDNLNKLLSNFTFPVFINQLKTQFKNQLIQSIFQFVYRQILQKKIIDANIIKNYFNLFIQIQQKLSIPSNFNKKMVQLKQQLQNFINQIGTLYEQQLYQQFIQTNTQEQLLNILTLNQTVKQLRTQQFQTFFCIFKSYSPKKTYKQNFNIHKKCIYVCAKLQYNLNVYENLKKIQLKQEINTTKFQLSSRHARQSLFKLTQFLKQQQNLQNLTKAQIINIMKYKCMCVNFFMNKILNSSNGTVLIFQQMDTIFNFTKQFILLMLRLKQYISTSHLYINQNNQESNQINYVMMLFEEQLFLIVQLNQNLSNCKQKQKQSMKQLQTQIKNIRRSSFSVIPIQLDEDNGRADLQLQCQVTQNQLKFYQIIIQKIHFYQKSNHQKTLNSNQQLKGLFYAIIYNKIQEIIQPLYKLYFISLHKCENHKREHLKFIKQKQNNKYKVKIQDDCQVIQQDQYENNYDSIIYSKCSRNIKSHNYFSKINPIGFYIFLQYLNSNQNIKIELESYFNDWIRNVSNNQLEDKNNDNYFKFLSLQQIIKSLVQNYTINDNQNKKYQQYVLKCLNLLLVMFRNPKFNIFTKKQIISSCFDFISDELKSIKHKISNNTQNLSSNQYYELGNKISIRLQCLTNLFELMINIHFSQYKVNIFNEQFYIFHSYQQDDFKSILRLNHNDQNFIIDIFKNSKSICDLFHQTLTFILEFPQELITKSFCPNIENSLIKLTKQIYFQLSHFVNIYIFSSKNYVSQFQNSNFMLFQIEVQETFSTQQKYAIEINQVNIKDIVFSYTLLIKYISKVLHFTNISERNEWLQVRNKDLRPFFEYITDFIKKISKRLDILNLLFERNQQKIQQSQFDFQQNCLISSIQMILQSVFNFLSQFLTNFQQYPISYLTHNIPLITIIYEFIQLVSNLNNNKITDKLLKIKFQLNKIIIFKNIINQKQQVSKKSSNNKFSEKSQISQQKRYFGWQYIKRLFEGEQQQILQQIQNYEYKFKYSIKYQSKNSQKISNITKEDKQSLDKTQYPQINQLNSPKKLQNMNYSQNKRDNILQKEARWSQIQDKQQNNDKSQNNFQQNNNKQNKQQNKQKQIYQSNIGVTLSEQDQSYFYHNNEFEQIQQNKKILLMDSPQKQCQQNLQNQLIDLNKPIDDNLTVIDVLDQNQSDPDSDISSIHQNKLTIIQQEELSNSKQKNSSKIHKQ